MQSPEKSASMPRTLWKGYLMSYYFIRKSEAPLMSASGNEPQADDAGSRLYLVLSHPLY